MLGLELKIDISDHIMDHHLMIMRLLGTVQGYEILSCMRTTMELMDGDHLSALNKLTFRLYTIWYE